MPGTMFPLRDSSYSGREEMYDDGEEERLSPPPLDDDDEDDEEDADPADVSDPQDIDDGSDGILADDVDEHADDLEMTNPVERLYEFVKSDLLYHRVYIARELPVLTETMDPGEAIEYVVPLMNQLCGDLDDTVRETFVPELEKLIWFFYSTCDVREPGPEDEADIEPLPQRPRTPGRPATPARPHTPSVPQRPQTPQPGQAPPDSTDIACREDPAIMTDRTDVMDMTDMYEPLEDDADPAETPLDDLPRPCIPPSMFTPMLHALLLDQTTSIAASAQSVVLQLAEKLLEDDTLEPRNQELLIKEMLEGVVLGVGRIDQERPRREDLSDLDFDANGRSGGLPNGEDEAELGRMTMFSLMASLAAAIGPEKCVQLFVPELDRMAEEQAVYVRKEAAAAIGGLASVVPVDVITSKLLPVFDHFSADTRWHVRRSCCQVLPTICRRLPDDLKAERAVQGLDLFAGDVSRSVRAIAGEIIGELIATFQQSESVPESLIQHFLGLGPEKDGIHGSSVVNGPHFGGLGQQESERPVICAYNFPAVVVTLGPDRWDDLKDTYFSLTKDHQSIYQMKVRRSLACSLHEIAKVIGPEKSERDLLAPFDIYLKDQGDVKTGIIEHLADFMACLSPNVRNAQLPELSNLWSSPGQPWRLRDEIARQIPALCKLCESQAIIDHLLPLTINAVQDEVACVRETAVASFPTILECVRGDEIPYSTAIDQVKRLAREERFRGRVVYVQICHSLISNDFPKEEFEIHFLPVLKTLGSDRVINVRIAVSRLVADLCDAEGYYANGEIRHKMVDYLLTLLASDTATDVRSFVLPYLASEEDEQAEFTTSRMTTEPIDGSLVTTNGDPAEAQYDYSETADDGTNITQGMQNTNAQKTQTTQPHESDSAHVRRDVQTTQPHESDFGNVNQGSQTTQQHKSASENVNQGAETTQQHKSASAHVNQEAQTTKPHENNSVHVNLEENGDAVFVKREDTTGVILAERDQSSEACDQPKVAVPLTEGISSGKDSSYNLETKTEPGEGILRDIPMDQLRIADDAKDDCQMSSDASRSEQPSVNWEETQSADSSPQPEPATMTVSASSMPPLPAPRSVEAPIQKIGAGIESDDSPGTFMLNNGVVVGPSPGTGKRT